MRTQALLLSLGLVAGGTLPVAADERPVEKEKPKEPERPVLRERQGRFFRWAAPEGWTSNETANGVDMTAPDGKTGATSTLLMGAFGRMTPRDYIAQRAAALGLTDVKVLSAKDLPDQPGPFGIAWRVVEEELSFTCQGTPVRALVTCGVVQGQGQYCATMSACQAPVASWYCARHWLPAIVRSVLITNPKEVAGLDRIQLPRNNPLDDSAIRDVWKAKGVSEDRISQARREGTMGYERVKSPSTGRAYELPLERYDPKVGGYRNPEKPDEVLVKPAPGK